MKYFENIGLNIQRLMADRELTQEEVSHQLNMGKAILADILAGKKALNTREISRIAPVLSATAEDLCKTNPPKKQKLTETQEANIKFVQKLFAEYVKLENRYISIHTE